MRLVYLRGGGGVKLYPPVPWGLGGGGREGGRGKRGVYLLHQAASCLTHSLRIQCKLQPSSISSIQPLILMQISFLCAVSFV